jgi:hypothetical protein
MTKYVYLLGCTWPQPPERDEAACQTMYFEH